MHLYSTSLLDRPPCSAMTHLSFLYFYHHKFVVVIFAKGLNDITLLTDERNLIKLV